MKDSYLGKTDTSLVVGMCSANVSRSGIFEAVLSYTAQDTPLEGKITGSGINVEKILTNTVDADNQRRILEAGLTYNVVRGDIKKEVEDIVKNKSGNKERLSELYAEIGHTVRGAIITARNQILEESGIDSKFFPTHLKTFKPENNSPIVLPVVSKYEKQLKDMYNNEKAGAKTKVYQQEVLNGTITAQSIEVITPHIQTYGSLVCVGELPDNPEGGKKALKEQVQYFMDTRNIALEKIQELLH